MNALELADEWDKYCGETLEWNGKSSKVLSAMLRQQQAEIEALKKNLDVALMIVNEPAKTLTDEEINELYVDYQNPDYYSREVIFDQLGFARAILRKAQEK